MARFNDKLFKVAAQQDNSLGQLTDLMNQGFTTCVWQKSWAPCPKCVGLHGSTYNIQYFISGLAHGAPIFEKSHVNCRCVILVQNPTTGDEVEVPAF